MCLPIGSIDEVDVNVEKRVCASKVYETLEKLFHFHHLHINIRSHLLVCEGLRQIGLDIWHSNDSA